MIDDCEECPPISVEITPSSASAEIEYIRLFHRRGPILTVVHIRGRDNPRFLIQTGGAFSPSELDALIELIAEAKHQIVCAEQEDDRTQKDVLAYSMEQAAAVVKEDQA